MNGLRGLLLILLLTTLVGVILAGCKTPEIRSCWAVSPVEIDGDMTDWLDRPTTFFEEESVVLGICNDSEKLYIHFRTRDPKWARIIKATGLTLYLDPDGKRSQDFSLRFNAGPIDRRQMDYQQPRPMMNNTAEPRLTCYIKDRIIEKPIPLDGSEGPSAAFDTSHGFYCYELAVPLDSGGVRYYGLGASLSQTIGIGISWGDVDQLRKDRGNSPGGGRPSGGMGGKGRRGGGAPPSGGKNLPEKQEVWVKTVLQQQPY